MQINVTNDAMLGRLNDRLVYDRAVELEIENKELKRNKDKAIILIKELEKKIKEITGVPFEFTEIQEIIDTLEGSYEK